MKLYLVRHRASTAHQPGNLMARAVRRSASAGHSARRGGAAGAARAPTGLLGDLPRALATAGAWRTMAFPRQSRRGGRCADRTASAGRPPGTSAPIGRRMPHHHDPHLPRGPPRRARRRVVEGLRPRPGSSPPRSKAPVHTPLPATSRGRCCPIGPSPPYVTSSPPRRPAPRALSLTTGRSGPSSTTTSASPPTSGGSSRPLTVACRCSSSATAGWICVSSTTLLTSPPSTTDCDVRDGALVHGQGDVGRRAEAALRDRSVLRRRRRGGPTGRQHS